jgi:hypothetical protein
MDKQEHIFRDEGSPLQPTRLILGDISSADSEWHNKPNQPASKSGRDIKITVKRIIAHLQKD